MNVTDLASAIFDVQPDTLSTEHLVHISAMPDNCLVRSYFCDPQTGTSILSDYTDSELDKLFAECKSLDDATERVTAMHGSQPLTAVESNRARSLVFRAFVEATITVAQLRKLENDRDCLRAVLLLIATDIQTFLKNLQ